MSIFGRLTNWLDVRIGLDEFIKEQFTEYRVPRNVNIFYTLGFVSIFAYVIQSVTGFFLLFYYIPHPEHAFASVQTIMNVAPYGWLFRMLHVVGSNMLVVVAGLHMASVFFMQSYKKPRELTWVVGALMFLVTLGFCLSGYLLPWSQLSYWATTVVTTMPTAFPYIGSRVSEILRGGGMVAGSTLSRFFAVHVYLLPALLVALIGLHLFLVRRIGISSAVTGQEGKTEVEWEKYRHEEHPDGPPFFPYFFSREALMVLLYYAAIFAVVAFLPTLFFPADANVPANPFKTPEHIKPEWYFLAPYQMLKMIPDKFMGILMQILALTVFVFWPLFDRRSERNIFKRPYLLGAFAGGLVLWLVLTLWGRVS